MADFLDDGLDADRRLSPATIENYSYYLLKANITAFRKDNAITVPAEMTAEKLKEFERALQDLGASPGTIDGYHRCIKNFLGFCGRRGLAGRTASETAREAQDRALAVMALKAPKMTIPEMRGFTDAEIATMRQALKDRPRDLMLVNLLLATGLRLAEAVDLNIADISGRDLPRRALVHVKKGKGGEARDIPLWEEERIQLNHYISRDRVPRGRPRPATDALFLTNRADGGVQVALTTSAIQTLFKRLGTGTGIHVNPHKFRHTFATNALGRGGLDVMALQKALGHTTLEMTSRYVHKSTEDLQRAWMTAKRW